MAITAIIDSKKKTAFDIRDPNYKYEDENGTSKTETRYVRMISSQDGTENYYTNNFIYPSNDPEYIKKQFDFCESGWFTNFIYNINYMDWDIANKINMVDVLGVSFSTNIYYVPELGDSQTGGGFTFKDSHGGDLLQLSIRPDWVYSWESIDFGILMNYGDIGKSIRITAKEHKRYKLVATTSICKKNNGAYYLQISLIYNNKLCDIVEENSSYYFIYPDNKGLYKGGNSIYIKLIDSMPEYNLEYLSKDFDDNSNCKASIIVKYKI